MDMLRNDSWQLYSLAVICLPLALLSLLLSCVITPSGVKRRVLLPISTGAFGVGLAALCVTSFFVFLAAASLQEALYVSSPPLAMLVLASLFRVMGVCVACARDEER